MRSEFEKYGVIKHFDESLATLNLRLNICYSDMSNNFYPKVKRIEIMVSKYSPFEVVARCLARLNEHESDFIRY